MIGSSLAAISSPLKKKTIGKRASDFYSKYFDNKFLLKTLELKIIITKFDFKCNFLIRHKGFERLDTYNFSMRTDEAPPPPLQMEVHPISPFFNL